MEGKLAGGFVPLDRLKTKLNLKLNLDNKHYEIIGMAAFLYSQVTSVLKLLMESVCNGVLQLCNSCLQILM